MTKQYDGTNERIYDGSNPDDFNYDEGLYECAGNTGQWWQSKAGIDEMKKDELDIFLKGSKAPMDLGTTFKMP
jgi:hypothetical protein